MVSYQKFVSLYFEQRGANDRDEATNAMSAAADLWNENKADLRTATVSEVRDALRRA